jgi:thiamine biosynthesis lipoprotein
MIYQTRLLMGMPITIRIADAESTVAHLDRIFAHFEYVDDTFSTYKPTSEIARLNRGELTVAEASADVQAIFALAEKTRQQTDGFFDIRRPDGAYDPSGIVKGWAVRQAADLLGAAGLHNFIIDAGGDLQVSGTNAGALWRVGVRNPFDRSQYVKVLALRDRGVATSGTAIRGQHIYNPHQPDAPLDEIASLTVVGPDVYEADRLATAGFAMGRAGIRFIEALPEFEAYQIDVKAQATATSGLERYVVRA